MCTQLHVGKYPNHIDHQGLTIVDRTWDPHAEPLELDPGHECGQVNLYLVTVLHANKRSLIQPDGNPGTKNSMVNFYHKLDYGILFRDFLISNIICLVGRLSAISNICYMYL